jgi:hypothetical protein
VEARKAACPSPLPGWFHLSPPLLKAETQNQSGNWEEKVAQIDSKENSVVAVYAQHSDAENAINLLKKSDFNIK